MKKRTKIWFAILISFLAAFLLTGCKPKEVITERIEYRADSTAIWRLQTQLNQKELEVSSLKTDLSISRNEVIRLNSEIFRLETFYDTSKPIVPETGKPPVQSEITTITKNELERTIQEKETLIQEFRKEVKTLTTKNDNLELEIESLKQENSDLKSKAVPWFSLKSFLWGVGAGVVLLLLLVFFLQK